MAFKLVGGFPESFAFVAPVTAGTAINEGDALAINGNVLERATASSTIHTLFGIARETITTAATEILVAPVCQGQLFQGDMKNNTHATNQIFESAIFDTSATIDNTSSDVTGPTGIWLMLQPIGAVGDKKALGEFTRLQSTST